MNAARKQEAPAIDSRAIDLLDNLQTLFVLMQTLLSSTFAEAVGDFRSDLAATLNMLRNLESENIIAGETAAAARIAIEDALNPADDLRDVDREALAGLFDVIAQVQAHAVARLRRPLPAPRKSARTTRPDGVVVGLFDSDPRAS